MSCSFRLLLALLLPIGALAQMPAERRFSAIDSLLLAAARNDTVAAARMLARGADVNGVAAEDIAVVIDQDQRFISAKTAPINLAVGAGNLPLTRLLLNHGANPNRVGGSWELTPLKEVMHAGPGVSRVLVQLLLDRGAQPNLRTGHDSTTALHVAIWNQEHCPPAVVLEKVQLLLAAGARLDVSDQDGETPLRYAVHWNEVAVASYLIDRGAWTLEGVGCQTLLSAAVESSEMMALLLRQRAEVNAFDCKGKTPLCAAVEGGAATVVEMLLRAGADACARTRPGDEYGKPREGTTPLLTAVYREKMAVVRLLLDAGADPNDPDRQSTNQDTPLLIALGNAARDRNPSFIGPSELPGVVDLLIRRGADTNRPNQEGTTPLHLAAATGDSALVAALLARGANPTLANQKGETPLFYSQSPGVVHLLLARGASFAVGHSNPLLQRTLSLATARACLQAGASLAGTTEEGETPLHLAASSENSIKLLRLYLDQGANLEAVNAHGATPLAEAVGDSVKVELLLRRGAHPNGASPATSMPLVAAIRSGAYAVVSLLLRHGVSVRSGQVLFHAIGALPYEFGMMRLLLDAGADPNARDKDGCPVLAVWVPSACGEHEGAGVAYLTGVTEMLLNHGADPWLRNKAGKTPLDLVQAYPYATRERAGQLALLTARMGPVELPTQPKARRKPR